MKVLIAEDDVFFQKLLTRVLSPEFELVLAHDGNEAWAALQQPDAPRLAILDWVMPGMSGPQVCREVRACAALSSMYLIILTSKNNEADIVSGLRAGADDYITKPPIPAALRARVRVGMRVLALQDAVHQASVLENRVRESLAGDTANRRFPGQPNLPGMEACLLQQFQAGDCSSIPGAEASIIRTPLGHSLENRNHQS
jgi:DNA-binding response OmpR family regulator